MRAVAIVALAAAAGAAIASCRPGRPDCLCSPIQPIEGGVMKITRSSVPELAGGEVDARRDKVVVRYTVDGEPREIVYDVVPR